MRHRGRSLTLEEVQIWAQVARTVKPLETRRTPVVPKGAGGIALTKAINAPKAVNAPKAMGAGHVQGVGASPAGGGVPQMTMAMALDMPKKVKGRVPLPLPPKPIPSKPQVASQLHLDGSWEKRISKGTLVPDVSLDLHGSNLDQAYVRLMHGLTQAKAMGARVVLIVTGRSRPVDAADRSSSRGAIRAKVPDWMAASEHASDIVAIRGAHGRHGGQGAIYVILKKHR